MTKGQLLADRTIPEQLRELIEGMPPRMRNAILAAFDLGRRAEREVAKRDTNEPQPKGSN